MSHKMYNEQDPWSFMERKTLRWHTTWTSGDKESFQAACVTYFPTVASVVLLPYSLTSLRGVVSLIESVTKQ